jgi:hypothetical protein
MDSNRLTQYNLLTAAGLQDLILLPESKAYKDHQISYWAADAPPAPHVHCSASQYRRGIQSYLDMRAKKERLGHRCRCHSQCLPQPFYS